MFKTHHHDHERGAYNTFIMSEQIEAPAPTSPFITFDEVSQAFEKFNVEDRGKVPYKQLKCVMRELGLDPREAEVAKCVDWLKNWQKNDDRATHFTASDLFDLINQRKKDANLEEIRTAFRLFDVAGKGFISVDDLKTVTEELKETLKPEELEEMLNVIRLKIPEKVSFEEFAIIMKKTALY
uniref:EF-hand domain-containing protein n=1 Tax=Panagrellus redivivus TaxID=6233 RepID=A0A7E4UX62_PANRE